MQKPFDRLRARLNLVVFATALALAASCGGSQSGSGFSGGASGNGDAGLSGGSGSTFVSDAAPWSGYSGDGGPCVNLQCAEVDCSSKGLAKDATTVTGTVYNPAGKNPVYDAIVYVPNEPVKPFVEGVVCDQCGVFTTGNPVVSTLSDPRGHFQLRNVPVGANIPLVIQIGKWRRQTTLTMVNACTDNPVTDPNQTRLPANQSEGDMPQLALATGGCDAFECLLRKIGISDSEFTPGTGAGRVHVYQGLNGIGLYQSTASTGLWSSVTQMKKYRSRHQLVRVLRASPRKDGRDAPKSCGLRERGGPRVRHALQLLLDQSRAQRVPHHRVVHARNAGP